METPLHHRDPVPACLDAAGIVSLRDQALARATELRDELRALATAEAPPSFDEVLGRLDEIAWRLRLVVGVPYLMGEAHPDEAVREAGRSCEPLADAFETALWLDEDVARAVRRVADGREELDGAAARLLTHTLRDLRRNGLELPAAGRARLSALNDELTRVGQSFSLNIASASGQIEVASSSLDGLPKEWAAAKRAAPLPDGRIPISTDYPDYFPFVKYANDRAAALALYVQFERRAADTNVALLERLIALREEKARLLGYATWADYVIEPRMAKSAANVRDFLVRVRGSVAAPAARELAELRAMHAKLGGREDDALVPPDRLYLEEKVRAARYGLDSQRLAEFFEVASVKRGVLDVASRLFGISFRPVDTPTWHADVEAYDVADDARILGRLFLDLHPRPSKFKHAAVFGLASRRVFADGRTPLPQAALVCNFARPTAGQPALMGHEDVVTFFHEAGHVLHQLLTEARFASFSGTSVARDFVETPSQMFEEWAWQRPSLDIFARHFETGERLPDDLYGAMHRARGFGRALATQRQLFLAALDLEYHTRPAGFDTSAVLRELWAEWQPFAFVEGTCFQAGFGHLVGYDAGYYGYQWALSLSRDVLTRFLPDRWLSTETARAFRECVLARGGEVDETEMVTRFLGRAPTPDAYVAYLAGQQ